MQVQLGSFRSLTQDSCAAKQKDNAQIGGLLSTPSQSEIQCPLPTAVLVRGGLHDRIRTFSTGAAYSNWAPWLVSAGYAVLCPNHRSSSSYGEAFATAT